MDFVQPKSKFYCSIQKILKSEVLPGALLLISTIIALAIANSSLGTEYHHILEDKIIGNITIHAFINDFLMAIFFLVVGSEIKKEVISGHLSNIKKASFPVIGSIGGVTVPAIIFFLINRGTSYSNGVGIPISTDIAFALGAFMIFKKKLNPSLKIFLLTLAVVDDLMSIAIIGIFYSSSIRIVPLLIAGIILIVLFNIHKINKSNSLVPYMILGIFLWYFVYQSGIHATISGVLLAMTIPMAKKEEECCILSKVEEGLCYYANLVILPLFAFANTGILLSLNSFSADSRTLSLGIIIGLVVGKPVGILLFTMIASKLNLTEKTKGVKWTEVLSVATIAGIGFTMSIFVSEIAFSEMSQALDLAKISILIAAVISCLIAFITINIIPKKVS
ncbi:Na+/H+ antiporter NhaA [Clostridium paraputrificum]|uniref:Na+/H+ antiporter NhaA n=1 Tax=Clostridium paraputrificum TaxID=29363 RepID=UPI003D345530